MLCPVFDCFQKAYYGSINVCYWYYLALSLLSLSPIISPPHLSPYPFISHQFLSIPPSSISLHPSSISLHPSSISLSIPQSLPQTLLPSQYWYYMIELGFYVSLVFSVASDVKRKVSVQHACSTKHTMLVTIKYTVYKWSTKNGGTESLYLQSYSL